MARPGSVAVLYVTSNRGPACIGPTEQSDEQVVVLVFFPQKKKEHTPPAIGEREGNPYDCVRANSLSCLLLSFVLLCLSFSALRVMFFNRLGLVPFKSGLCKKKIFRHIKFAIHTWSTKCR
jgi:hypothetical protein